MKFFHENNLRRINAIYRIIDLSLLGDGWHFGRGARISPNSIRLAVEILRRAFEYRFDKIDSVPCITGGIEVVASKGGLRAEVEIDPDESASLLIEVDGEQEVDIECAPFGLVLDEFVKHARSPWIGCGLSIGSIICENMESSRPRYSVPEAIAAFPSFNENASIVRGSQFAPIYANTTAEAQGSLRFIGSSQDPGYRSIIRFNTTPPTETNAITS